MELLEVIQFLFGFFIGFILGIFSAFGLFIYFTEVKNKGD